MAAPVHVRSIYEIYLALHYNKHFLRIFEQRLFQNNTKNIYITPKTLNNNKFVVVVGVC